MQRYFTALVSAAVSPIMEFGFAFARTIILSRLLTPDHLGAAIVFSTIIGSSELLTDIGLGHFVIVSNDEDAAQSVAVAQQITVLRSVILAVTIVLFANVLATLFDASGEVDYIRWLGLVLLVRGFRNWRVIQIQKKYQYGPQAIANAVSLIGSVVAAFIFAIWLRDASAMLISLLTEAVLYTFVSRIIIKNEHISIIDSRVRKSALIFGLPLLANGVGTILCAQLDRVFVSHIFGLAELSLYAITVNLVLTPTSVLTAIINKLAIPYLVEARLVLAHARQEAQMISWLILCCGAVYAVAVGLMVDWLEPIIYGPHYTVPTSFHVLLTTAAYLRVFRIAPNVILLAHSKTRRITSGTMLAGSGTIIGCLLAVNFNRIELVLLGLVLSEIVGVVSLFFLSRQYVPLAALTGHTILLGIPVGLASFAPSLPMTSTLEACVIVIVGATCIVCVDGYIAYRTFLNERGFDWKWGKR
jgi:O-antigen/teichoic acid export membrane protein